MKKHEAPTPGLGDRTIEDPEAQDPLLAAGVDAEDDEEEEEEEDGNAEEPTLLKPLEDELQDKPFKLYTLSNKPPQEQESEQRKRWWQTANEYISKGVERADLTKYLNDTTPRESGLLKMKVRVIEEETSEQFLKDEPTLNLRKMFAERPCKVRVYVYFAQGLSPRANGDHPQPFLKVYNVLDRVRTTRDTATPPSLDPDFERKIFMTIDRH